MKHQQKDNSHNGTLASADPGASNGVIANHWIQFHQFTTSYIHNTVWFLYVFFLQMSTFYETVALQKKQKSRQLHNHNHNRVRACKSASYSFVYSTAWSIGACLVTPVRSIMVYA